MAFKSTTQKAPIQKISHLYHLFEQFRYFLLLIFRTNVCYASNLKGALAFQSYDSVRLSVSVT